MTCEFKRGNLQMASCGSNSGALLSVDAVTPTTPAASHEAPRVGGGRDQAAMLPRRTPTHLGDFAFGPLTTRQWDKS